MYKEFEGLLNEQAPIESYTEWLDTMVERCVVQVSHVTFFVFLDIQSLDIPQGSFGFFL